MPDQPGGPPQPPQRDSSSSWRRDAASSFPPRTDSSVSWPQLSCLGGLPTSYSHDARKASPLTSTALSSASNPYGLPASMNPGLPSSTSASTSDSSNSPASPSWSTWQSILRERENTNRILRGSLYQGPQTSKDVHQSSSSSTSSHNNNPQPLTGRSYRPPSTATMSSDSAAGHGSSSTTWARSQKSSQTSLRSYPSPSMMLMKLQQEGGGGAGGGGSSLTHGSGGGGRASTTVDTSSSAPATPNIDDSTDEGEGKGAGAVGPRTSAGPDVPVSPTSTDFAGLLDSPLPLPPSSSQWQQQWQQQPEGPGEEQPSAHHGQEYLDSGLEEKGEDSRNLSATSRGDTSDPRSREQRPPLSPIPGSLSGSDSLPIPTPKSSGLPVPAGSAILFPQQAAAARSSVAPPHDATSSSSSYSSPSITSPASEERHRTAFVHEARAKYKELQALHLAELEGYDRVFEAEGVLTAKNGCEQVFMPKPTLSVQRFEPGEGAQRKWSTSSGGRCLSGAAADESTAPMRAVSFERNRRPTAKSLSALASASTPNLRATSTMQEGGNISRGSRRFTGHHRPPPPLPRNAGPLFFPSTRLPPLPSSPLQPLGGRARSNSEPRSPTRLLSVQPPASADADAPAPTTPALDASTSSASSSSSSGESSLRSSLDLETVLRQGRELEEERQMWRRQFAKSIEGYGSTAVLPKVVPGKPASRPRELMSRYELFQAGPISPNNERGGRPRLSRTFSRRVSVDKGGGSGLYEPLAGSPRRKSAAGAGEEGDAAAAAGGGAQPSSSGAGGRRRVSTFLLRSSRSSPHLRASGLVAAAAAGPAGKGGKKTDRKVSIQEPLSEGERDDDDGHDDEIVFAPTMCFPPASPASVVSSPKKANLSTPKVKSPHRQGKPLPSPPPLAPHNLTSAFDDSLDSPASRRVLANARQTTTAAERRRANLTSDETVVIAAKEKEKEAEVSQREEEEEEPTAREAKGKEEELPEGAAAAAAAAAVASASSTPSTSSPSQAARPSFTRARHSGSGSLSRGSVRGRGSEESRSTSPPHSNRPSTGGASTRKGSSSSAAVRRYGGGGGASGGGGGSRPSSPPPPHPPPDEPLPALPFAAMGQPPAPAGATTTPPTKRSTPPSPSSSPRRRTQPLGLAISGASTGDSATSPSSPLGQSGSGSGGGLLSRVARAALPTAIVPKSPSFRKPVPSMHIEGQEFVLTRPGSSSGSGSRAKSAQQQQAPPPPHMPASASSIGMRAHRGPGPGAASTSASRDTAMTRSGTSGSTGAATSTTAEWVLSTDQDQRVPRASSSFDSFAAYRGMLMGGGAPARPESILEPTLVGSRGGAGGEVEATSRLQQQQQQQQQRSLSDVGRGTRPNRQEVAVQTGGARDDAVGSALRLATARPSAGQPASSTSLPASPYSPTPSAADIEEPEVHRSTSAAALRRRGSSSAGGRGSSAGGGSAGGGGAGGWHSAASSIMSRDTAAGVGAGGAAGGSSGGGGAPTYEMWNADREDVAGEDLFLQRLRSTRSQAEMEARRAAAVARRAEAAGEGKTAAAAAGRDEAAGPNEEAGRSSGGGSGSARRWWMPQQQQKK